MENQNQKSLLNNISLSVVIPVCNEAENIGKLFEEMKAVCQAGIDGRPFDYEIILSTMDLQTGRRGSAGR